MRLFINIFIFTHCLFLQIQSSQIFIFNNSDKFVEALILKSSWCCDKLLSSLELPQRNGYITLSYKENVKIRILVNQIPEVDYFIEKNKSYKIVVSNDNICFRYLSAYIN